jgi:dTDP-4-dehydrorhamnose reductase
MTHWFITGASGLLGHTLCRHLLHCGCDVTAVRLSHPIGPGVVRDRAVDLSDNPAVRALFDESKPDVVVHAAGLTNVDACEDNRALAFQLHSGVAGSLAERCGSIGARFVHISTDHLWDGTRPMMEESAPPSPVNIYAHSKAEGERTVLSTNPRALIVRTNFFGEGLPWRKSLSDWMVERLRSGDGLDAFIDSHFTPIHLDALASTIVEMVDRDAGGIYHIAGRDRISKYDFAMRLCRKLNLPADLVRRAKIDEARLKARRPHDLSLSTDKISAFLGRAMPSIDEGIAALGLKA